MSKNRVLPRTILAVAGDDPTRIMIGQTLRKEGYKVIEAPDGPSALQLVREHRPSLIILDSALPGVDAYELCSQLRGMPFVTRALILFVSVDENAARIAQALDAGGDDYLRKPFAARELRARVEAQLRRSPSTEMPRGVPALRLDPHHHTVTVAGRQVMLTPTEYHFWNTSASTRMTITPPRPCWRKSGSIRPAPAIRRWFATTCAICAARSK